MAILARFRVSGMSAEKYETVLRRLESAGAVAPRGRLYHVSFGSRESLQVIDVYDSRQSLEAFGKTLLPILGEMGIKAEPELQEVHRIIEG